MVISSVYTALFITCVCCDGVSVLSVRCSYVCECYCAGQCVSVFLSVVLCFFASVSVISCASLSFGFLTA